MLIVARQRSGTNFLRGLLSTAGGILDRGEVFQPRPPTDKSSYDDWVEASGAKRPISQADAVLHSEQFLHALGSTEVPVSVDVKYNSLYRTVGVWQSPADPPPVLIAAARQQFVFVHLLRANRLEHAVSTMVAQVTRIYVAPSAAQAVEQDQVRLNPGDVIKVARHYEREAAVTKRWLDAIAKQLPLATPVTLYYEDLAGFSSASRENVERVVDLCGVELSGNMAAKTQKVVRNWKERVENSEEIEKAFDDAFSDDRSRVQSG